MVFATASFMLPGESEVWDQWKCPQIDDELEQLGSPLLTVPTPGRLPPASSRRQSHASYTTASSSAPNQHVRVLVRVRPSTFEVNGCLDAGEQKIIITPPADEVNNPPPTN